MNDEQKARIANRAHHLWLLAGCPEGREEEHWRQAEAEINAEGPAPAGAPGRMPEDVRAALANAVLARSFALERGQDVGDEVIATLADTRLELDQNTWTKDKEVAFWKCYLKLNSTLSPITIETVRAIRQEARTSTWFGALSQKLGLRVFHSTSPATIATRQYRVWGILALVLVLVLQVYYAMGSGLLREREELLKQVENDPGLVNDPGLLVEHEKSLQAVNAGVRQTQASLEANKAGGLAENLLARVPRPIPIRLDINANFDAIEGLNELNPLWLLLAPDNVEREQRRIISYGYLKMLLDAIAVYFLPLLYGLLGACAYIIRTVSVEIQQVRYSQETHTRFELRLFLGALAGLAVVWFIKPDDPHITIPTVALAFLAGYSVELVFVAMDRLVATFGGETQSRPSGAPAEGAAKAPGKS